MITIKLAWLTARSNGLASTGCDGSPARFGEHSARSIAGWMLWCGCILLFGFLGACSKPPSIEERPVETAPPSAPAIKTTEFVVLIDNSASIRPPEQVIIREATMLLADLADSGDRISVIGFGENARLVTSVRFQGDNDRRAFKEAIRQGLDFKEKLSDIRAGIRLLAEQRQALFPTPAATHAAVLFSDGRLEPRNTAAPEALQQMRADLQGPLANLERYAVVLGDTSSRQPIPALSPPLTGLDLMRQQVARGPEYFYHARQLEQLPEVAVTILNKTKGIASLGEESGTAFRIDHTVRAMTLIVRKRPPNALAGSDLPTAQQIQLNPPDAAATPEESIYRSSDYQHFDLFVVRNPRPGLWRVTRSDGKPPSVLSKIDSPLALQWQARPRYDLNEAAGLRAWLWDGETQKVVKDDYQIQAHLAPAGGLANSQTYLTMARDDQGQAVLVVPAAFSTALGTALSAGQRLELELIAKNSTDPWFLRRSPPLAIELGAPIIDWFQPAAVTRTLLLRAVPLLGRTLSFTLGGQTVAAEYTKVGFEVPPELTVTVERFDKETNQYGAYFEGKIPAVTENQALVFRTPLAVKDYGDYRYRYRLAGQTASGPLTLHSPWYGFRVQRFWELEVLLAVVLLGLIQLISRWTARLNGLVRTESSTGLHPARSEPVKRRRIYDSKALDLCGGHFRVKPKRDLFVFKRFCVTALRTDTQLDGSPLTKDKTRCVSARSKHALRYQCPDGDIMTVTLTLRV